MRKQENFLKKQTDLTVLQIGCVGLRESVDAD